MKAKPKTATGGFSAEEKAAARERVRELKAEAAKADGETELFAAIAKMQEPTLQFPTWRRQRTAFFTREVIFASSVAVNLLSAY